MLHRHSDEAFAHTNCLVSKQLFVGNQPFASSADPLCGSDGNAEGTHSAVRRKAVRSPLATHPPSVIWNPDWADFLPAPSCQRLLFNLSLMTLLAQLSLFARGPHVRRFARVASMRMQIEFSYASRCVNAYASTILLGSTRQYHSLLHSMPLPPCGDMRASQARATRWATALSGFLPTPEHRIVGFTCKDCVKPRLYTTPLALVTHCAIALRSGKHKSDTGPLPRSHVRYHDQHEGNLLAVLNVALPGTCDNPQTRVLIPVNSQGLPHMDRLVPSVAQHVPQASSTELNSEDMDRDVPHDANIDNALPEDMDRDVPHDANIGNALPDAGQNPIHTVDQPAAGRNSFAETVQLQPQYSLLDVLKEGMDKITLSRTQSDSIQGWGTMIARLNALKAFGLHRIQCRPRCRPPATEDAPQVTASEAAFLHTTKHCSSQMKDELLHMIRHPHFDPAQIRWTSGISMVAWSLKHVFTAEVNEEVLEHRKSHHLWIVCHMMCLQCCHNCVAHRVLTGCL